MANGYIIASIRTDDMETMHRLTEASAPVISQFGRSVLMQHQKPDLREAAQTGASVVVEFDDVETAQPFCESDGYTSAKAIREAVAATDLRIVAVV